MGHLSERIVVHDYANPCALEDAVILLDENGIGADIDSGDRIMVSPNDLDDVIELLDSAGFDFDII